nr:hypothetical protein Iba_chr14bCG15800 [Ipomoea batatas]
MGIPAAAEVIGGGLRRPILRPYSLSLDATAASEGFPVSKELSSSSVPAADCTVTLARDLLPLSPAALVSSRRRRDGCSSSGARWRSALNRLGRPAGRARVAAERLRNVTRRDAMAVIAPLCSGDTMARCGRRKKLPGVPFLSPFC